MSTISQSHNGSILLVGASRGLGHAMAQEFATRGWAVTATVRDRSSPSPLDDLAKALPDRIEIETLDITDQAGTAALRSRLGERRFDILFVNAGTANQNQAETIAEVATDEFVRVMVTNALGVMRAVEGLCGLVREEGTIGVMSSGQGSIANNMKGGHEVYRGSKAALNQYMRSFAARHADDSMPMVLIAPGWIRTELGGPDAPLAIEDSIPKVVDVLLAQKGRPGLRYLDRNGEIVPW